MDISEDFAKANIQSSDKITRHGYQRFYPLFLNHLREIEGINLLEIGFHEGNSVSLWNTYFKKPNIYAIDIKDEVSHPALTAYYKVDQSKLEELSKFTQDVKVTFHFILDDGSHAPIHQWNTFIEFFPLVKDGGTYIIEDVETSFWGKSNVYGYSIDTSKFSLFKKFEAIPYIINSEFTASDLQKRWRLSSKEFEVIKSIEMLGVGNNCFTLIKKDQSRFKNYYRTHDDYPMKNNINSERRDIIYRLINKFNLKKWWAKLGR